MAKAKLQIVTIEGKNYFGKLNGNQFKGILTKEEGTLARYIERKALKDLRVITIGELKNVTTEQIAPEDALELARLKGLWKIAEKQVIPQMTSTLFRKVAGKK